MVSLRLVETRDGERVQTWDIIEGKTYVIGREMPADVRLSFFCSSILNVFNFTLISFTDDFTPDAHFKLYGDYRDIGQQSAGFQLGVG